MCDALAEVHRDVSAQTMTQSEEGSVITFVQKGRGRQGGQVISMSKVKSVQYQALKLI